MTVYDVSLQTLSPLHIGDGNELRQDFDFVVRDEEINGKPQKYTYVLNTDVILQTKGMKKDERGRYLPPGKLLQDADFEDGDFFRYVLLGAPRSEETDARMKSFIKDVYDKPYIPGSSLKGAIRTALAWTGWEEVNPILDKEAIGFKKSWAGQPLEKKLFGPDPNRDLLRTLHVADLFCGKEASDSLSVINARVFTKQTPQSPIELEALRRNLVFNGTITVDDALFNPAAEKILHFGKHRHWLNELILRVKRHSKERIDGLQEWFENASQAYSKTAQFYRRLSQLHDDLSPRQAFLQLGWGGGWDGKTFWTHLQEDPELLEWIIEKFNMNIESAETAPREVGDEFPRSKRASAIYGEGDSISAIFPFGWALLELKEVERA